jgi:hypothetical protein
MRLDGSFAVSTFRHLFHVGFFHAIDLCLIGLFLLLQLFSLRRFEGQILLIPCREEVGPEVFFCIHSGSNILTDIAIEEIQRITVEVAFVATGSHD